MHARRPKRSSGYGVSTGRNKGLKVEAHPSRVDTVHEALAIKNRGETPELTSRRLEDLVRQYLAKISERCSYRPDLVLETWPRIVGSQIASMTKALRFENKTLYVSVKNSTLLSILSRPSDKNRLVKALRDAMPGIIIEDILFRFG